MAQTKGDKLMGKMGNLTEDQAKSVIAHLIGRGEVFADRGNNELLDCIDKAIDEVGA